MGLRKFGIKEASKAGVFARTKEQKETVFAMLALMNVPVVIKEQITKAVAKFNKKISKKADKLVTLSDKVDCLELDLEYDVGCRDGLHETSQAWEL